jgi:hypothetical protein
MTNQLKTNPWTLDTPAATPITTVHIKINNIEFVLFTATTDTVVIQDRNGNNVWDANGSGTTGGIIVRSGHIGWIDGLILLTLTGPGKVKVFFE